MFILSLSSCNISILIISFGNFNFFQRPQENQQSVVTFCVFCLCSLQASTHFCVYVHLAVRYYVIQSILTFVRLNNKVTKA